MEKAVLEKLLQAFVGVSAASDDVLRGRGWGDEAGRWNFPIRIKIISEAIMIHIKYAVVIATYNRRQLLEECIDHVRNQTIAPDSIIVVNNASADDTGNYLINLAKQNELFDMINLPRNIGGAGGFSKGIERALEKGADCVLIIDDDAMIAGDYMEQILRMRERQPQYKAFAGTVKTEGKIDTFHRRNIQKAGLRFRNCKEREYTQPIFACDIASFCGLVVDTDLIKQIGLLHADYFICHDDAEYSLRIRRYTGILVVPKAELNHKAERDDVAYPRRYDWKDYYAVRNRLLMVREHGNFMDQAINYIDLFIRVIFRNWLFGVMKRDGYDWGYERRLIRKAIRDAGRL